MSEKKATPEEAVEEKPKSPLIKIIVAVVVFLLLIAGTVVGTLFITGSGPFKPAPSADEMLSEDGGQQAAPATDVQGAKGAKGAKDPKKTGGPDAAKKADDKSPKLISKSPETPRFDYTYFQMERDFLVNLAGSRKIMSVQIAVVTRYDQRVIDNVKKHEFALRSVIMDVMRVTTEADLAKPDFRKDLTIKIRDAMNSLVEKYEDFGGIDDVYFTAFIVQ